MEFDAGPFTVLFGRNNSGKTNILEAIYDAILGEAFEPASNARRRYYLKPTPTRRADSEFESMGFGALYAEMEEVIQYDGNVIAALAESGSPSLHCVAFADGSWYGTDPHDSYLSLHNALENGDDLGTLYGVPAIEYFQELEPVKSPRLSALLLDWKFSELNEKVEKAIVPLARAGGEPWLEEVGIEDETDLALYRIQPKTLAVLGQLASLATDLLPDFLDGQVFASISRPSEWGFSKRIFLEYDDRAGGQPTDLPSDIDDGALRVESIGQGAARWIAAAVQVALDLLSRYPEVTRLRDLGLRGSGTVLLLDEPEAHLHPSAVASAVRWCHRMVAHGFTVVVASHHEEFLRGSGDEVTLVHVTRDTHKLESIARSLPSAALSRLRELADDIGMHPASVLSLHKAILFVEGPLDEAVLEEYADLEFDSVGIKIIPIHGTKNYEGIVSAELITGLGIKIGVLFDKVITQTMHERVNSRRSTEEKKLLKLIALFEQRGLPMPTVFGVPEDDLLWALPADGIRRFLSPEFPGWKEMREECRHALGAGPSDSFDWKTYALEHYRLEINSPDGVRRIVRELDLSNVEMPSLRTAVDAIVRWAASP